MCILGDKTRNWTRVSCSTDGTSCFLCAWKPCWSQQTCPTRQAERLLKQFEIASAIPCFQETSFYTKRFRVNNRVRNEFTCSWFYFLSSWALSEWALSPRRRERVLVAATCGKSHASGGAVRWTLTRSSHSSWSFCTVRPPPQADRITAGPLRWRLSAHVWILKPDWSKVATKKYVKSSRISHQKTGTCALLYFRL